MKKKTFKQLVEESLPTIDNVSSQYLQSTQTLNNFLKALQKNPALNQQYGKMMKEIQEKFGATKKTIDYLQAQKNNQVNQQANQVKEVAKQGIEANQSADGSQNIVGQNVPKAASDQVIIPKRNA
jgi:hypothetical protein